MGKIYTPDVSIENTENDIYYRVWLVATGLRRLTNGSYVSTELYGQIEPANRTYTPPSDERIRYNGISIVGAISGFTLGRSRPTSSHYETISILGKTVVGSRGLAPLTDSNWWGSPDAQYPNTLRIYRIVRADGKMAVKCTPDSCRVDCAGAPDGFCCIDHSFTDRLLQQLKN